MITIRSNFIWNFKTGDNVNHNLRILALLYGHFAVSNGEQRHLLCKPMILLIAAVTEAVLQDFHVRCRQHVMEVMKNMPFEALEIIKLKRISKFDKYIESAKRHDLFKDSAGDLYSDLKTLCAWRNRIHIQNERNEGEPNEWNVYTLSRKEVAERCLERVLKILSRHHPRPEHIDHVADFVLPWNAYYS